MASFDVADCSTARFGTKREKHETSRVLDREDGESNHRGVALFDESLRQLEDQMDVTLQVPVAMQLV
jgi:hypothetical protein